MSHRFDATLKDIVAQHPGDFAAVFGLPTNGPVTTLNVDLSTISAATDVALGFGDPLREIVDLNFQSGPDPKVPGRNLLYNAALYSRYGVTVRSVLVLLRPKADAANLTGKLAYGDGAQRVEFGYAVFRLWQEPVDSFLHGGFAILPLATLCQMPTDKPLPDALRDVIRAMDRRLGAETNEAEAARLMTAAYILTTLRVNDKDALTAIYRGVGPMQDMAVYDQVLEEGEIRQSHKLLLRLGRKQFGTPDAATEAALTSITDLERLERLADAILTAKSWPELLATG